MTQSDPSQEPFGSGDVTYQAVGQIAGIERLVDQFYDNMEALVSLQTVRAMHPDDLTQSRRKLVYFLSGWMGGPKLYAQHYGSRTLPVAHRHLPIDLAAKNAWLYCMDKSLRDLEYPEALRNYLMEKFATPAEGIRLMCE